MAEFDTTPSVSKTAFSCPHCGAYTTQTWYKAMSDKYPEDQRTPIFPSTEVIESLKQDTKLDQGTIDSLVTWAKKINSGKLFLENSSEATYCRTTISNCYISECYNCGELAIWAHNRLIHPASKIEILPNGDMPPHIRSLFDEAREIVASSPKGAAALLRLCIQHLCKELGESGKNIDSDIANLVRKGLNPLVQQALDIVRVIGNESVHPGELNLNDNREISLKLFELVNLICDQMITHPKQVQRIYRNLPSGKLEGIERRDAKERDEK
ncbi:DUF4145 domain-containing protein [Pseudomonas sp. GCEP-101]|uniref:DUF4145 domain-containing protein n=1 Tax=Pseudomonas sp. GCEP-101 TaxID=2974552 RepID=UPI00223B056A|nr:DUF4145 domain-containing protein [Pseudomonas sp. GCEP-101]